jgi:hypothetical protein
VSVSRKDKQRAKAQSVRGIWPGAPVPAEVRIRDGKKTVAYRNGKRVKAPKGLL